MIDMKKSQEKMCQSIKDYPSIQPEIFFNTIHDFSHSAKLLCLINTSVKYQIFDNLDSWKSMDEIISFIPKTEIGELLIQGLIDTGFLEFKDGKIKNSPISDVYLSHTSPYFQGKFLEKTIRHIHDLWIPLEKIIAEGPVKYDEESFYAEYSLPSMAENAMSGRLQTVVDGITDLPNFLDLKKVIDLGGGHGLYAIALACRNEHIQATVFDYPGVVHLANQYIKKYHMENRVNTLGGNFFYDSFGSGYDLILSSSNPSGKNPIMLKKISQALVPGGYFVSIQPGDKEMPYNPINELEWELWTFEEVHGSKKNWGKNKKFLTEEFLHALKENGLNVYSITEISDPYMKDYNVTMLIAEKRG